MHVCVSMFVDVFGLVAGRSLILPFFRVHMQMHASGSMVQTGEEGKKLIPSI